jgi:5'-3' exonuclease
MYVPLFFDLAEHSETFDWECKFKSSTALSPLEQLVAILPGKSAYLLPEPLRVLSTSAESPLADMFPTDFEVDMEGKKQ